MPEFKGQLGALIQDIEAFRITDAVCEFRTSSTVEESISREPFSEQALKKLINDLKKPSLTEFEIEWMLNEHLTWATASFPKEKATKAFENLVNNYEFAKNNPSQSNQPIQIAINFNGTNNTIHTKKNKNDELIEAHKDKFNFTLQVPGVGSSATLTGDPIGLLEKEMKKYKDIPNHPFRELFDAIKPTWYQRAARVLFGGLVRKFRIINGNGTFYASLYAAMKVYELHQQHPESPINLNVFGHSRGSVSALFFNLIIKKLQDTGHLTMPISEVQVLNDPVPGGDLSKPNDVKKALKDGAFNRYKRLKLGFVNDDGLVNALQNSSQPGFIKNSLITYPVGETRVLFSPLHKITFDKATRSTTVLIPGSHNESVFGDYAVALYSLGMRKESRLIAGNISPVRDNHRRRHIASFYQYLTNLFIKYSESGPEAPPFQYCINKEESNKLLETYAKFMVEGYAKHILTDNYVVLQTDQARNPASLAIKKASMPQYFMDSLHEAIFEEQYPKLYKHFKNKGNAEGIQSNPELNTEFKKLPISMKRVLMYHAPNQEPKEPTKPKAIDSKAPFGYLLSGLFGLMSRFWKLFTRQSFGYERIPLKDRYRETDSKPDEKIRPAFNKLSMDKSLKYIKEDAKCSTSKIFDEIHKYKHKLEDKMHGTRVLSDKRKAVLESKIRLLNELEYYELKKPKETLTTQSAQLPTPLYFFYEKAPELMAVYTHSRKLQAIWHSNELDKMGSLDDQMGLLDFYQIVTNDQTAQLTDLGLAEFQELNQKKQRIEGYLGRKVTQVDDIDGIEEQIREQCGISLKPR